MRLHSIRKFFLLLLFYIAVGFLILVLQFRNESSIIKTLGELKITMAKVQDEGSEQKLKNMLLASFLGVNFSASDTNPVLLTYQDGSKEKLVLDTYTESENQCTFTFKGGAALSFNVAGSGETSRLEITASLPENADSISIDYSASSGYSITGNSAKQLIFSSPKNEFSLKAAAFSENAMHLSSTESSALFSPYDAKSVFTFETSQSFELADKKAFEKNIASLRAKITQDFASVAENDPSSITEEVVMAYVAEMALNNKYKEALDSVPSSFKRSSRRTFRTTPYFGNLVDMNRTLAMQLNNDKTIIAQALTSDSLDIFTNWDIVPYILIMKGTENIHRLLSIPSSMQTFEPTLAQAAGILNLYSIFAKNDKSCADLLESVLDKCLEVIENACKITDDKISLIENEVKAQEIATLQTGAALVSYGSVAGRGDISATGRFILNTALFDLQAYDLRVLCEIYQMLVKDNIFYPRVIILDGETDPTSPVWVFTAANEVKANFIDNTIELRYKFPMLESHYSFVVGVKSFKSIEIYGMNYRTDPRFESYNSSGYSYSADTKTLLLKTRHKAAEEFIKVTLK